MKYLWPVLIVIFLTVGYLLYQKGSISFLQNSPTNSPEIKTSQSSSGCQTFTNLQQALRSALSVCKLDLSSQGLKSLPSEVGKMENLEEFNVSGNLLTGFPAEVGRFKKLRILNLSNNQISGLPAEIGHLSNLETLDLSNNKFDAMPMEFASLKNLKLLNISNNKYKNIPQEIYSMSALQELGISGNQLTQAQINELKQKLPQVKVN